jgi:solute:Na+ symporter, SSS family
MKRSSMIDWTALSVFTMLFVLVTVLGFLASRWRRGDLNHLHEWGLGGSRFGTIVSWFLLGGDLYTAYTFIAIPALVYASGAIGFFAVPYTIWAYPIGFMFLPRLWEICRENGYITLADFVHGRHGSRALECAIALTGLLAIMPYIALQLIGIQVVIAAMGVAGQGLMGDLPLIIAFIILACYTYTSGLRAPALIAFVKDTLIFITIAAAMIVIPSKLGGFGHIFAIAQSALAARPKPASSILAPAGFTAYVTLALGSATTLCLYPHIITGILSTRGTDCIRKNMALLPLYSFLLALISLLGYMAIAAGITPHTSNDTVPLLFKAMFPSWFTGVTFAAIAIGALVPAAIMSIAAANLVTRNIYVRYLHPNATSAEQTRVAKRTSLLVKVGALVFIVAVPIRYAVDMQLLGGVWILQTLPAVLLGLIRSPLHERALFLGWFVGMIVGTTMATLQQFSLITSLHIGGMTMGCYTALIALCVNIAFACLLTPLCKAIGIPRRNDACRRDHEKAVANVAHSP